MVLLRGLFGTRLSYVPTVLNIAQLIGWGTFELIVIADATKTLLDGGPRWLYVIIAAVLTTLLTIWPLGSVRMLRRFVTAAVAIALVYFYVQFVRAGIPDLSQGSWSKFWIGADAALAVSISWVPLAADYTRHSRSTKSAFGAASVSYSATQIVAYVLGLMALALAASGSSDNAYQPFQSVALGALFFAVLVLREVDQSFADNYSTAVSIQNLVPRADRRVLTVLLGALTAGLALVLNIDNYFGFLGLIGSVFVPMLGVLVVDFFVLGRGRNWNVSAAAPSRWGMIAAWGAGFVVYQLINPGDAGRWTDFWTGMQGWLHFTPATWMSASVLSFVVAGLAAYVVGTVGARSPDPAESSA
jgi:purine-cytosine permease-like protein